jgi:hypothetical protein
MPPIITNATSLTNGDVIKNENAIPSGILAFKNPTKIGIEEHEQKGVAAPKTAAAKFPNPYLGFCIKFLNFEEFKNVLIKEMIKTTKNTRRRIFILS